MRRLPSLSGLEAFMAVARLGSVKAAAADLASVHACPFAPHPDAGTPYRRAAVRPRSPRYAH